jgi:YggT family protein
MYVIGYLLSAIAKILDTLLYFYLLIVIARAILSWVNPDPYNPIVRFLHNATEPVLQRIRSKIPTAYGGIDFSPIILILAIYFMQEFVVNILRDTAGRILLSG